MNKELKENIIGKLVYIKSAGFEIDDLETADMLNDFFSKEIDTLLDGLKGETKSVEELRFFMDNAYNDLSVKVAFKEGYNQAVKEFNDKLKELYDTTK